MNSVVLKAWMSSLRLKTLPLACGGIITGTALASAYGVAIDGMVFLFSLLTAVLLQVVSNLANDYGDMTKGVDTQERVGPCRGMQQGIISFTQMKKGIFFVCGLGIVSGLVLIFYACHSIFDGVIFVLLGVVSLVAAILYTVGRHAYGYYGLGDLAVLVFFGYVSVMGSFYLQAHCIGLYSFLPASACGLLGVLVLNVNNMRDLKEDKQHGKYTLAVRLGARKVRYYHCLLLCGSLFFLSAFALIYVSNNLYVWLFLLVLPLFYVNGSVVFSCSDSATLQKQLAAAVKINVFTLLLFSIGLCLN